MMLVLLACAPVEGPAPSAPAEVRVGLDGPRLARRMSLDLRGVLPSVEELDAVEADPAALSGLRDAWLDEPAFEERLVALLGERWGTLVDDVTLQPAEVGFTEAEEYRYERSVGEEPLRLLARIVADDRPWSEAVTSDVTMANEVLAALWPLDYPAGGTGWREARYLDGRPAAGVLATNGLWWRYTTNESNANRGRASAISRLLLCEDYLARPVSFSATRTEVAAEDAARTDPACLGCHASLDPLAANLFGFWWFQEHHLDETSWYHADREPLAESVLGTGPAWFGEPLPGLVGLGDAIAADPRFTRCAAESFAELLWRRPVERGDFDTITALEGALVDADLRVKPLLAAVTDGPEYRAGALVAGAGAAAEARVRTRRVLGADLLASAVAELTGFTWTDALGVSLLHEDETGFRVLAGGVDGESVRTPQPTPGVTSALVARRLAEAAGAYAAHADLVEGRRHLLVEVTLADVPGDPAFDAELARLWWRTLAVRPTDADLAALSALWSAVAATDGAEAAWAATIAALLRDPEFQSR